jgi:hypothetical protein
LHVLDDLDESDPLWARVRAARPLPPPMLLTSVHARLPVRRHPFSNVAIALATLTAVAAVVIAIVGTGSRRDLVQRSFPDRSGSPPPAVNDARVVDAMQQDAPPVDAEARARTFAEVLQAGDIKGATAMMHVPVVQRGCGKQHAADTAEAARSLATCVAGLELVKHGRITSVRHSTLEEVALAATYFDRRRRTHAGGADDLRALEADHDLVAVVLSTRREPYHHEGYEAGSMYVAVDRAGRVSAVVLGPVKIAD